MFKQPVFWLVTVLAIGVAGYYYSVQTGDNGAKSYDGVPTRIKCLVGGPDPYWKMVIAGAESAAKKYRAKLDVFVPESIESSVEEQTAELLTMSESATDGIMLSPLDPDKQTRLISEVAAKKPVVTFDNEAPNAIAHFHIGANNQMGGKQAVELIQRALPDGGQIALFVGDLNRETARSRRQVIINKLAGRTPFEPVSDALDEKIEAGKYTIVGTYLDDRNAEKAKENARLALKEHPEVKCMVGLYSKNGPACADALEAAEKGEVVKVVAFDQLDATLQAIREGKIIGTVVQDPFAYGFEGVRLLCDLHKREDETAPTKYSGRLTVACRIVDAGNLEEYATELNTQLKK